MGLRLKVVINTQPLKAIRSRIHEAENAAATEAKEHILAEAQRIVPVRTGFLWSTLAGMVDGNIFRVKASAFYAGFVELGTRLMAAQPYLVPALFSTPFDDIIKRALQKIGLD